MWTSQVGQAETQKWLATHPQQLDGIAVQSSGETGVLQALLQSGRDIPPISIGGELGALCYWRKNPDYISAAIQTWPPGDDIELGWNIMMRTMQGQGPKIQSILVPTVVIEYEEVKALLDENCDRNSTEWLNVGIDVWGGTDYLDQFFLRPANPEEYDPASH
jgi:ribose transport system substrate-binding protein